MRTTRYQAIMPSPLPGGERLGLQLNEMGLTALDFLPGSTAIQAPADVKTGQIVEQLMDYFADPARGFEIPLAPGGSPYQQGVWNAMLNIGTGQTRSYGDLAETIHSGARAVANACRANPIPIIIPCHRVVAANGRGGYMGQTHGPAMVIKNWLLEHERGRRAA